MGRSLQVKPEFIRKIKEAVRRNGYPSQQALASGLGLSRDVVSRFLNGKPIDYLNAEEICRALNLDLGEMTGYGQEINDESVLIGTQTALVNIVDPNFVGRESAIADLNALTAKEAKVILIQGAGGVGKTTLARKYLADKFGDKVIEFPIAKETKDIAPIEGLLEQCLRSLGEEPGRDFLVSLTRLKEKLQTEAMGVLIDNLEPALDGFGRLIEAHRRYLELLRILSDPTVKSITLITSREALGEGVDISLYRLPILDLEAWQTYFYNRGVTDNNQAIEQIWSAYQGNALAMKLLSERVFLDYAGDIVTFGKEQQKLGTLLNVENLVEEQFERLENIYPDAYKLLCRVGCYRYQDVKNVPLEGLFCLLWDVAESQRGQVINALRDRSLVDYSNGKYHLHPLIRNEAINRLRNSEDWKKSNIEAAEFWTENVTNIDTVNDSLKALEAYYHYFNIDDYEKASQVILLPRNNKFQVLENLGEAFCRLGLLERMIACANKLIPYLDEGYLLIDKSLSLVALYNLLGALHSYRGEITRSIKCYQISGGICERYIQMAQESEQKLFWKKQLNKVCYFIGLCKVDLFELEEAKTFFEKALNSYMLEFCHKNGFNESEIKVAKIDILVYMAFLYSCLSQEEEARKLANELLIDIFDKDLFFSSWTKGYNPLFLGITFKNLGEFEKSFNMYYHAIEYAKASSFNQIEATALIYLGELYRIQEKYETALDYHFQSIEILHKIGAKCDLAEAYFQLALTYQAMGDQPNSQTYFDKALELWGPEKIDAPKQIERVKKAMQTTFA
jgi:tetratricopeptide (TPR) repeat protein/transcriptional regulator with XRE-family HTH domain